MTRYEELLTTAEKMKLLVIELNLGTDKKCGKYFDNIIIINSNMTKSEKLEILAEEIGHHNTSYGHICDQKSIENRKQEAYARRNGYKYIAKPKDIIEAVKNGAYDLNSIADYFFVSPELLADIIEDWKKQYGLGIKLGEYYLQLNPWVNLQKVIY